MDTTIEFDPTGFGNAMGGAVGGIFSGISASSANSTYGTNGYGGPGSLNLGGILSGLFGGGGMQAGASVGMDGTTMIILFVVFLALLWFFMR